MLASCWLRWTLGFAAWTLVGVLFASQTYVGAAYTPRPLTWAQAFAIGLTAWYVRAALSPIVRWLTRRFPISRERLASRVFVHVAAGVAWSVGATVASQWVLTALANVPRPGLSPVEFHASLLTYAVLVGLTQGADYYRRYRERELKAARLEARLATARLDLLRMQLNPHFLFNALHDLSELMHEDVERAERMVQDLSELLRLALRHLGEPEVPLSEEVSFLRRYLELEQMRFQDRLEARVDVDAEALSARVPYLILQPLVENAVRHGIAPRLERGRVEVRGRADGEALVLEVYDDGPGVAPQGGNEREGIALRGTRERLRESYGAAHRFEMRDLAGGGLCVRLELPLRRNRPAASAAGD
ncbi:MAG: sensor histidine kinase [Gemmatimonadaceae bacterium]